jgi:hypothetical protein
MDTSRKTQDARRGWNAHGSRLKAHGRKERLPHRKSGSGVPESAVGRKSWVMGHAWTQATGLRAQGANRKMEEDATYKTQDA